MKIKNNNSKYLNFRNQYLSFYYEKHTFFIDKNELIIRFYFNIDNIHFFTPSITIPLKRFFIENSKNIINNDLEIIVFNMGMVELISYWKSFCPQNVIIKNYKLDIEQISFWKKLYYNGLSEFFYTNSIKTDFASFMNIYCESEQELKKITFQNSDSIIVPIGGGKDSVVSLELLKNEYSAIVPLIINARGATINTSKIGGFEVDSVFEINRTIDKNLLELNDAGCLNGHTPFSAMLAFTTILASYLTKINTVALSNESSANENTVINSNVNHQYSKSFEFEQDFRNYISSFVANNHNYFSYLRPLSELQIAFLFSQNNKYFYDFRSCNVGSKTDTWCCNCPKCLFAFIILSTFIEINILTKIFGQNLFENINLLIFLKELTGISKIKPFECVGTIEEVNLALAKTISKWNKSAPLPYLLEYFSNTEIYKNFCEGNFDSFMKIFNYENNLSEKLLKNLIEKF